MSDQLQRFIFDHTAVRGNIVQLSNTFQNALEHQKYPPIIHQLLGELMAASTLLAATLKIDGGALVLQIQGKGIIQLLVVECTINHQSQAITLRATAKLSNDTLNINLERTSLESTNLSQLIGNGHFVITLDPKDGGQTYQGIVPIEGETIAEILQNYMQRSEQIETRIWLACDESKAAGMLLQKLPKTKSQDADAWHRFNHLANTVQFDELLNTSSDRLLYNLFHQEIVRVFDAQTVLFKCKCSGINVRNMLKMLGVEELETILEEQNIVEINCDFCNKKYTFDKVDIKQLFTSNVVASDNDFRH